MKYFKNPENDNVYGYDREQQQFLIEDAEKAGWIDITNSWPPVPTVPIPTDGQLQARAYLFSTDWYVTRMAETGKPIPDDVLQKRQEARALLN